LEVPGVGRLSAGKLIGEIAGIERFKSDAQLAHFAGCAPIPASSGVTQRWRFDRQGNRQLNTAFYRIALTQARVHPGARAYLAKKRAEGSRAPKSSAASSAFWSESSGRHRPLPVSSELLFLHLDFGSVV
jgi:transposase